MTMQLEAGKTISATDKRTIIACQSCGRFCAWNKGGNPPLPPNVYDRGNKTHCQKCHRRLTSGSTREKKSPGRHGGFHYDDLIWMIDTGEHTDMIALRLGVQRESIYTALRRKGDTVRLALLKQRLVDEDQVQHTYPTSGSVAAPWRKYFTC